MKVQLEVTTFLGIHNPVVVKVQDLEKLMDPREDCQQTNSWIKKKLHAMKTL